MARSNSDFQTTFAPEDMYMHLYDLAAVDPNSPTTRPSTMEKLAAVLDMPLGAANSNLSSSKNALQTASNTKHETGKQFCDLQFLLQQLQPLTHE